MIKDQENKGLLIIFTGNGKGKTSAAMGIMARSLGHGLRVGVLQFIKSPDRSYGESIFARKHGTHYESLGNGFVFNPETDETSCQNALAAWEKAKEAISSHAFDVLILDEITYLFHWHWLEVNETINWLKAHRPSEMHIVMTGRYAPEALMDYADLVTEMREIKHPLKLQKIHAQKGIDF